MRFGEDLESYCEGSDHDEGSVCDLIASKVWVETTYLVIRTESHVTRKVYARRLTHIL